MKGKHFCLKIPRQEGEAPARQVSGWFWKVRRGARAGCADLWEVGTRAALRPTRDRGGRGEEPLTLSTKKPGP